MEDLELFNRLVLPVVFGLFGFVEPCSIASTLMMVKQIEGRPARDKLAQLLVFALTRAVFIGLLGMVAAIVGSAFFGFQRAAWFLLGLLYLGLGGLYLAGRAGALMRSVGPRLDRLRGARGSVALGLLFGLNIPACAAPLLLALLAASAAGGAAASGAAQGFVTLSLFGLALSLPLLVAALFAPARAALDRLASLSGRLPRWTGIVLVALGAWSIWFALAVSLDPPAPAVHG